jgi:subtilase family serine protease
MEEVQIDETFNRVNGGSNGGTAVWLHHFRPGQTTFGGGRVIIPESSQAHAGDAGVRFHTHVQVFMPNVEKPNAGPPYSGYAFETPASLACVYYLVSDTTNAPNCNPNNAALTNPTGGSKTIAIVDAYDDPNAESDLDYFSGQFGLPAPTFAVVYANGTQPIQDPTGGWEFEEALDIEWAHAMASNAKIILVEAATNSNADLLQAVSVASNEVRCGQTTTCPRNATGTGEVSMSWGMEEYRGEIFNDAYFTMPGVVYISSPGDQPGVEYPCTSPNVVCAGGSTTARNPKNGNFLYELTWPEGGGGVSAYEPIPSYQSSISSIRSLVGLARGVPDVSFDSSPETAVWVYDTIEFEGDTGWFTAYGTSLANTAWAGIVNVAGRFASSSASELTTIYGHLGNSADFRDITYGWCGPYSGYSALTGWDFCTGVGSPIGYLGK